MVSVSFLYPKMLLLLFLIPSLVIVYLLGFLYNKKRAVAFPNFEALERISGGEVFSKNFISLYLNIAIIFLLVLGFSGTTLYVNAKTSSFSYVIALDNSGSMKASDILPNRLEAAKTSAKKFVDLLPLGVEVGVIEFSGETEVLQNLETSKIKTKMAIDSADFGEAQGTNIYDAVVSANTLLGNRRMKSIILISDGQLNVGDTGQIVRYATKTNLIINSIAMGTSEGGLTEFDTISKVDEDVLKAIAFNTDGQFFNADDQTAFDESFESILKRTDKEVAIDLSFYFIIIALALFFINWVIFNFRFRTIP